jgi:DNA-binding NarL/FixJ family response regulator
MTPDVVLTDIQLERGTGWDVLRAIAHKSAASRPVAMVLSNFVSEAYRSMARRLGADHFFDKSSEMALMLKTVREMAGPPALRVDGATS